MTSFERKCLHYYYYYSIIIINSCIQNKFVWFVVWIFYFYCGNPVIECYLSNSLLSIPMSVPNIRTSYIDNSFCKIMLYFFALKIILVIIQIVFLLIILKLWHVQTFATNIVFFTAANDLIRRDVVDVQIQFLHIPMSV